MIKISNEKVADFLMLKLGKLDNNFKKEELETVKSLFLNSKDSYGNDEEIDNNEPLKEVVLFQSLSKGTKMDLVIQKAVELGVSKIYPVETEFSVVKIKDESSKIIRWNRISMEAVKQCKRSKVPEVCEPIKFDKASPLPIANSIVITGRPNTMRHRT